MHDPIIDRKDAIELFRELIQPSGKQRVLRLVGEAKMGKSYLVTGIYRSLAEQHGARCAVLDLRMQTQSVPDILNAACSQLEGNFSAYRTAYRDWLNRPKVEVKDMRAVFAQVSVAARGEEDETSRHEAYLTAQFATDLKTLSDRPLVLLIDTVNSASPKMQGWLMEKLLVQVAPVQQVRTVVAGRHVPEPLGSYSPVCRSYELCAVTTDEEYIQYCQAAGITLPEQSIRDIAHLLDYAPGLFVDAVMPRFGPQVVTHA